MHHGINGDPNYCILSHLSLVIDMKFIVLFRLLLTAPVLALEHEDLVDRAFEKMNNGFEDSWAYTETSTRDKSRLVATYDPRRSEHLQWQLVSVDDIWPRSGGRPNCAAER